MSTSPRNQIALITNQRSGRYKASLISRLSYEIGNLAGPPQLLVSRGEGDSTARCVHEAARNGANAVIIIGGDGTVRYAIGAAAEIGLPIGVYPAGTVNLLARELGLPLRASPHWWAELFYRGGVLDLYAGQASFSEGRSQMFHSIASAGPDAAAVAGVNLSLKRVIGRAAYLLPALADFSRQREPMRIECGDEMMESHWALMARGRFYAGGYQLRATPLHGRRTFAVSVMKPRTPAMIGAAAIFRNRLESSARWRHLDATDIGISAPSGVPVQLDGDIAGTTPVKFSVAKKSISVICKPLPKPMA